MTNLIRCIAIGLGLALALGAPAHAQHLGDIVLDISNGRIRTNQFDVSGILTPGVRDFRVTLGAAAPNFTDSPGFDTTPGTFPYPSTNGFRIRKALRIWDGTRFVHIPGPMPETMQISFATLGPIYTPACDTIVNGFSLQVGSNGEWHRHLEYTLSDPGTPGVYLLELELFSSLASIAPTRPFWLVVLQPAIAGAPTAAETDGQSNALLWVAQHKVPQLCPADYNGDGVMSVQDIFDFLAAWFAGDLDADFNGDCTLAVQDIFDFLGAWFAGCP
jgi:hypothetical protein